MHAIKLMHPTANRPVIRIHKNRARALWASGEVSATDGVPADCPTPRDNEKTADKSFDAYANECDFYARNRVAYWGWGDL